MLALQQFLQTILDNVVLLLVLLPLIGAVLVRTLGRLSPEGACASAMTNVWASAGLALLMVANFSVESAETADAERRGPVWQMVSSIRWLSSEARESSGRSLTTSATADGSSRTRESSAGDQATSSTSSARSLMTSATSKDRGVRIELGIDGLGLLIVVLIVFVTLAAVSTVRADETRLLERLSGLLFVESALIAVVTAVDAVWLSFANLLATAAVFWLINLSGGPLRRLAARKFLRMQLASAVLLLAGVIGLAVSHWWMSIGRDGAGALTFVLPVIVQTLPKLAFATQAAHDFWMMHSYWLFLCLLGGAALRVPLPPFHHWWLDVADEADRRTTALLTVGWLPVGMLLIQRIVLPAFETSVQELGGRLLVGCGCGSLWIALSSLAMTSAARRLAAIVLVGSIAACGGLWAGTPATLSGALLLTCGLGGAAACIGLLRDDAVVGRAIVDVSSLLLLATFAGQWLLLQTWLSSGDGTGKWFLAALVLTTWTAIKSPMHASSSDGCWSWPRSKLAFMPLVVALLGLALLPQAIVSRME